MRVATTKGGRPRKEHTDVPKGHNYPKGTTHVTSNARDWFKACNPPAKVKYARTDTMKYFRRVREQDIGHKQATRWLPVTAAHVETAGREGWYR
jgi:hypothetical protein